MKAPPDRPAAQREISTRGLIKGLHYGWWIVISAIFNIFVCLGIGRFALGMLLPAMGEALSLSYAQMGWISTSNFLGYLIGALWVRRLLPRYGERQLIFYSSTLIVATMLCIAINQMFLPIAILYGFTGLGSGIVLVCTFSIIPHWFISSWRGRAIGFLSIGFGLAIILAGWSIPWIDRHIAQNGWSIGWGGLAIVCLPLVLFSLAIIRNRPQQIGLTPYGDKTAQAETNQTHNSPMIQAREILARVTWRLGIIYFLFGLTYVVYATFIITTLVREHEMDPEKAGQFWIWLGICSLFCGPLFGGLSDRFGRRASIAASLSFQAAAYALIAFGSGDWSVYLSVILFGLSAFGLPLIMGATVADYASPEKSAGILGALTAVFGTGQIIGPILAGVMADYSGEFTAAYLAAGSLATLAIALTMTLPDPPRMS